MQFSLAKIKNYTILIGFFLAVLGVIFYSLGISSYQIKTNSRAEFDGTACNDMADYTLNSSGSTQFTIRCTGNLLRPYTYALIHCPRQSAGSTYCGDPNEINAGIATVIDRDSGNSIPGTMNKSTSINCGCVQWDVGVLKSDGTEGIAGGVVICAQNACATDAAPTAPASDLSTAPTTGPTSGSSATATPVPSSTAPTATPVPSSTAPTATPVPSSTAPTVIPTTVTAVPTATNTLTPTPSPTSTYTPTPTYTLTPTRTPTRTPTATRPPTPTSTPLPTPTNTLVPTWTPVPTWTQVPTFTPLPTFTKIPTQPTKLAVGDQKPGFNPLFVIFVPIIALIAGLLL